MALMTILESRDVMLPVDLLFDQEALLLIDQRI